MNAQATVERISLNPPPRNCQRWPCGKKIRGDCTQRPRYLLGFKSGPVYYCEYHGDEANANPDRHKHIEFMWDLIDRKFINLEA